MRGKRIGTWDLFFRVGPLVEVNLYVFLGKTSIVQSIPSFRILKYGSYSTTEAC